MTHDDRGTPGAGLPDHENRLSALEAELRAMRSDLAELRQLVRAEHTRAPSSASSATQAASATPAASASSADSSPRGTSAPDEPSIVRALRSAPGRAGTSGMHGAITGDQLESFVGRYGTLVSGALVILLAVGTLIVWAVKSGLLTPTVRVAMGALAGVCVAAAGIHFRRKGELRYGNVLLALSLAITDVVAWGAGPQLHIVPTGVALAVVDLVAITLAMLALHDDSEFLFGISVAGALSAPFVTSDRTGNAVGLLTYGAVVLVGSLRAAREPTWRRSMALLVAGAAIYALAAAALPFGSQWYGPFLIPLFGGILSLAALVLAQHEWRGELARAYLATALLGVLVGWDVVASQALGTTATICLTLAAVTYCALWVREPDQPWWLASAVVLPMLSLGIASGAASGPHGQSGLLALWGLFALIASRAEGFRGETHRAGAHLMMTGLLVSAAISVDLFLHRPLAFVAALAGWGVVLSILARDESSSLPLIGLAAALGAACLSALEQLDSLRPYAYVPFMTRPSASALCASLGLAGASVILVRGRGGAALLADRGVRLGAVIGFVFMWARMELVHAFSLDTATFLLTLYYAGVGVGSIVAGRRIGFKALRIAGLALAIYAAAKAVIEATAISGLLLRVGCFAAVGMFMLGAGYLYRDVGFPREAPDPIAPHPVDEVVG